MNTLNIPKKPTEKWEWIKFQLRLRESSLSQIARQLGLSRNAVNNVKRVPYPRCERAIASALSLKPRTIWPDRWDASGEPKRQRPQAAERRQFNKGESNAACLTAHCQRDGEH